MAMPAWRVETRGTVFFCWVKKISFLRSLSFTENWLLGHAACGYHARVTATSQMEVDPPENEPIDEDVTMHDLAAIKEHNLELGAFLNRICFTPPECL